MATSDYFNIAEAISPEHADRVNADFYGRFPYPWPAEIFTIFEDPDFWRTMTNQELGIFDGLEPIPQGARIWVAGCGTNQAVQTALHFPGCEIYATDVSEPSLRSAEQAARSLGLRNVTFDVRSINDGTSLSFDYIVCTGVIHHNADPEGTLRILAHALTPSGVLELMVYNRYHRQETTALQKAIRLLSGGMGVRDASFQLEIAAKLMDGLAGDSAVLRHLRSLRHEHTSQLADSAVQPIEWTFTVESLASLLSSADAVLWLPTQNTFDIAEGHSWQLQFTDPALRSGYLRLPDLDRWQLANLLLADQSPMLWFYARPAAVSRPEHLSDQVDRGFAEAFLVRSQTTMSTYARDRRTGGYAVRARDVRHPAGLPPGQAGELYQSLSEPGRVREVMGQMGGALDPESLTRMREQLTTPYFPFLRKAPASPA